jgi:hypothetical protein
MAFADGIGRRVRTIDATGEAVESLYLCRELSDVPTTEAALVERAARLAPFAHSAFAAIRRVDRLRGALGGLALVSQAVAGVRLSELLRRAERKWVGPDLDASLSLIQQLVGAMADLHRYGRDLSHGALAPERLIVRPDGRLVIVEHAMGPAFEQLRLGRSVLWTQFRVAVPSVAGTTRFDQFTDVMQIGMVALALVLGRPIRRDEFPLKLQELLTEASTPDPLGDRPAVSQALRGWLVRAFQFDARSSFRSAVEAESGLRAVLAEERRRPASPSAVVRYLAACPTDPEPQPDASAQDANERPADVTSQSGSCAVGVIRSAERYATVRRFHRSDADGDPAVGRPGAAADGISRTPASPPSPRKGTADPSWVSVIAGGIAAAGRMAATRLATFSWGTSRRSLRVAIVAVTLAAVFGVAYLGARGYLGLPGFRTRTGTLTVESRPAGIELFVDGLPSGRTPATLEVSAGAHTLAFRTVKGTTLVPVTVAAGVRQVERIEIRPPKPPGRGVPVRALPPVRLP